MKKMGDREKITLIGGPRHNLEQWVLPADRFLKIPVALAQESIEYGDTGPQITPTHIRYDVAIYQRNLFIPEYFNFIRLESESGARLE
jgi:hypothetical protein